MPAAKFEPPISVSERSQTHALDREATGIGSSSRCLYKMLISVRYKTFII